MRFTFRTFAVVLALLLTLTGLGLVPTAMAAKPIIVGWNGREEFLPNGWDTPGLTNLTNVRLDGSVTNVLSDGEMTVGIGLHDGWLVDLGESDEMAYLRYYIWNAQLDDQAVHFNLYYEIEQYGVFKCAIRTNAVPQPMVNDTQGGIMTVRPPSALISVKFGEARVVPLVEPTGVEIPAEINVQAGKSVYLESKVYPENASTDFVEWKSSNPKVAKISHDKYGKDMVIGVKAGTATITATTLFGKKTATCRVTVLKHIKLTSMAKPATMFLQVGSSQQTVLKLKPANATVTPTFLSSNSAIASVDADGVVTANSPGVATIQVKADGKTQKFSVSTGTIPATNITISKAKATLKYRKSGQLHATILPMTASPNTAIWSSSNTKIVKVSQDGIVTAVGRGKATITAYSWNGMKATCKVTVK